MLTISDRIHELNEKLKEADPDTMDQIGSFITIPINQIYNHSLLYEKAALIELENQQIIAANKRRKADWEAAGKKKEDKPVKIKAQKPVTGVDGAGSLFGKIIFRQFERPKDVDPSNLPDLRKKFACSFRSEGTRASVNLQVKKQEKPEETENDFTYAIGIDPGVKYGFGAVVVDRATKAFSNYLLKTSSWYYKNK